MIDATGTHTACPKEGTTMATARIVRVWCSSPHNTVETVLHGVPETLTDEDVMVELRTRVGMDGVTYSLTPPPIVDVRHEDAMSCS
jgi:hypothetical protein